MEASQPTEEPSLQHIRDCRCGCIPPNMFSLFEMAEMRRKKRELQQEQQKQHIHEQLAPQIQSSIEETATNPNPNR
jgi:hypothetical protein